MNPTDAQHAESVANKRDLLALVDSIIRLPITYGQALEALRLLIADLQQFDGPEGTQ